MRWGAWLAFALAWVGCSAMYVPIDPETGSPMRKAQEQATEDEGASTSDEPPLEGGRVTKVLTGDLVTLEDGRRVRYIGVVAPRPGEAWFAEALQANREMVLGRQVRLNWTGEPTRTPSGAWLAYVLIPASELGSDKPGYVNASYAMVRSGAARAATMPEWYKGKLMLLRAEERAREAGIGIWQK